MGVVVLSEKPYAEFEGDSVELTLSKDQLEVLAKMKKAGIPLVVIVLSGRPVILDKIIENSDALVAAWLPGSEGQGVADVLFGNYKPSAKLSHSWPRAVTQLPLNAGDANYDPLFKYGFGLTW